MHNNYCTYLNSWLLEAPPEYVLHGHVPGLNWAPFWLLPMSMHLVATPSSVSCCLLQWFKFHTKCTSKHHNNPTRHMAHMYIHHNNITILLLIPSSYTSSILLDRLATRLVPSVTHILYWTGHSAEPAYYCLNVDKEIYFKENMPRIFWPIASSCIK
jgi:hypothetical protein